MINRKWGGDRNE